MGLVSTYAYTAKRVDSDKLSPRVARREMQPHKAELEALKADPETLFEPFPEVAKAGGGGRYIEQLIE